MKGFGHSPASDVTFRSMFLNFGRFSALLSYKKGFYKMRVCT